ncbi:MAG TPA: xanthine dehydrogenase small subunit [Rhizobacter sp.]|nr:xanthine dehydrogenase small subunit [Rhizobacter sp.]
MNPQPIRFYHRGAVVEVNGAHPTRSVLDWLREDARCTGTKEGCNEGDCGACTVVIGELAEAGDATAVRGLSLKTVNACIQFLPTLDGKALFTVEDVKGAKGLHPAQQAMVECHGSQCGFCTPGFVMSLWSTYERQMACSARPSRQELADELSGNLCRCTGYRPILDAGERMFELPTATLDTAPVVAALQGMQRSDGFHYAAFNRQVEGQERVDHFHAPRTLESLAALREQQPQAQLLAGCTDIGLWVNKQFRQLGDIIYLGDVAELKQIDEREGALYIGAGASLEAAWRALVQRWPALTDVWLRFASPPVRNAGTLGGNIANGSPIGDSAPVLMALDAQVLLRKGTRERRMPLAGFYIDYMKNQLQPGELLQALLVPLPTRAQQLRAYKVSKRFDCDISALCAGLAIELDGDTVTQVRIAFGGMAATVKRAAQAEAALIGQAWSQDSVKRAQAALAQDFTPLTDMRASAAYRLQVAQNLLQRFWLETRPQDALPAQATSVWGTMAHAELSVEGRP